MEIRPESYKGCIVILDCITYLKRHYGSYGLLFESFDESCQQLRIGAIEQVRIFGDHGARTFGSVSLRYVITITCTYVSYLALIVWFARS